MTGPPLGALRLTFFMAFSKTFLAASRFWPSKVPSNSRGTGWLSSFFVLSHLSKPGSPNRLPTFVRSALTPLPLFDRPVPRHHLASGVVRALADAKP